MDNQTQPPQLSHDAKTIIVVLLLVLSFPVGIIFMWLWMKTWQKWIKILLTVAPLIFVLFFVLLGFAFYMLGTNTIQRSEPKSYKQSPTPTLSTDTTPSATANWKTYTNQAYRFSLKYPNTLRISSKGDFAVDLVDTTINQTNITPKDIKIRISVNQIKRNFDKIYTSQDNSVIAEEQHALDAKFIKVKNSITDGYKTVSYIYEAPGNQTEKSFTTGNIINKNGILIELITLDTDTTTFDQILQTFRFTK